VGNLHLGTVAPGAVRGNHLHRRTRELLLVHYRGDWEPAWSAGPTGSAQRRQFSGDGCLGIRIPPGIAHAVRNAGTRELTVVALTDAPYSREDPDVVRRSLL
jgi:dTDP-4-dehydrorhamnose 3,5-epimerase-like enzyme